MTISIGKLKSLRQLLIAVSVLPVVTLHEAHADEPPVPSSDVKSETRPLGRITGRVVRDDDSTPVAGAEVRLLPPILPGHSNYSWPFPIRRTTTDAQGEFSYDGLAQGRHLVWADHDKLSSHRKSLGGQTVEIRQSDGSAVTIEVRLRRAIAVAARVRSKATGEAVAGAVIHAGYGSLDDFRTDENGGVTIQPLTPERWEVEAWGDGLAKQSLWLNLENGRDAELEIELSPGGDLEGVVRDPDGEPVAGVFVSANRADDRSGPFMSGKTDAEGCYTLRNAPLGATLTVRGSKLDYESQSRSVVLTQSGQRFDITLPRRPHGGSIQGIVIDGENRPITEARLVNYGRSSNEARNTTTGPNGRFLLENLYPGTSGPEIIVRANGFAPQRVAVEPGPADVPAEIKITLEPGHCISGRVINEQSQPLADVWVGYAGGDRPQSLGGNTRTDDDGRFELDSLPADCTFTFSKEGFTRIDDRLVALDAEGLSTIVMSPQGVVRGRVIDAAGKPVRAFKVRINASQKIASRERSVGLRSDWINPGQMFEADDGTFEITDIKLGAALLVMIEAPGFERSSVDPVKAQEPDRVATVEFMLKAENPADLLTYRGRLVSATGVPAAGVELRLIAAIDRPEQTEKYIPFHWNQVRPGDTASYPNVLRFEKLVTGGDGSFEFPRIPRKAQVQLVWWGNGVAPARRDHLERLTEERRGAIEIEVQPAAHITVRVDLRTYPKAAYLHLSTVDGIAPPNLFEVKAGQETVEFGDLTPGTYNITLSGPLEPISGREGSSKLASLDSSKVTLKFGETQVVEFPNVPEKDQAR